MSEGGAADSGETAPRDGEEPEEMPAVSDAAGTTRQTRLPEPLQRVLRVVPQEQREEVLAAFIQITEMHRGPLPRPADFEKYNAVLPGSADRILAMAEKEQNHRHTIDHKLVDGERSYATRGQWLAGVFFLLLIVSAFYVIAIRGNNWGGGILLGATTLAAVVAFLGRQLGFFDDQKNSETDET